MPGFHIHRFKPPYIQFPLIARHLSGVETTNSRPIYTPPEIIQSRVLQFIAERFDTVIEKWDLFRQLEITVGAMCVEGVEAKIYQNLPPDYNPTWKQALCMTEFYNIPAIADLLHRVHYHESLRTRSEQWEVYFLVWIRVPPQHSDYGESELYMCLISGDSRDKYKIIDHRLMGFSE